MNDFRKLRRNMVAHQIKARGIRDDNVLSAMRNVPRHLFVDTAWRAHAYEDRPLPIGEDQTISQPFVVARMIEALQLKGGEKLLEIGSGSGYASAVLSQIADKVHAVERIPALAEKARQALADAQIANVEIHSGDGTSGWTEAAPYDGILVSAAATIVPDQLKEQLAIGGHLVMPVGEPEEFQMLTCIHRLSETEYESEALTEVRFVPLVSRDAGTR